MKIKLSKLKSTKMKEVKFGINQFWKNTPVFIKQLRTGLMTFIGGSLMYSADIADWLHITTGKLNSIEGILLLAMTALLSMFGVKPDDVPETQTVSANIVGGRPDDKEPHPKP